MILSQNQLPHPKAKAPAQTEAYSIADKQSHTSAGCLFFCDSSHLS